MHIESNTEKSKDGTKLNQRMEKILQKLKEENVITYYKDNPSYAFPGYTHKQFRPDFEIIIGDTKIIIDNTTSVRSDRIKQKQIDAIGSKISLRNEGYKLKYFVIVPNEDEIGSDKTREEELKNYRREKRKRVNNEIFCLIDNIFTVNDFIDYLRNPNSNEEKNDKPAPTVEELLKLLLELLSSDKK